MTNCPKCNTQCEDKALFCENCGNRIPPKQEESNQSTTNSLKFCYSCGTKNELSAFFCNSCGKSMNQPQQNEPSRTAQQFQEQLDHSPSTFAENLSLWGYFIKCFKKYAVFSGRARRKEYWGFALFCSIFGIFMPFLGEVGSIFILGFLLPNWAVGVRRMHDVGKSGWFILIPIYNLVLALTDSEQGPNKYGPNPKF